MFRLAHLSVVDKNRLTDRTNHKRFGRSLAGTCQSTHRKRYISC